MPTIDLSQYSMPSSGKVSPTETDMGGQSYLLENLSKVSNTLAGLAAEKYNQEVEKAYEVEKVNYKSAYSNRVNQMEQEFDTEPLRTDAKFTGGLIGYTEGEDGFLKPISSSDKEYLTAKKSTVGQLKSYNLRKLNTEYNSTVKERFTAPLQADMIKDASSMDIASSAAYFKQDAEYRNSKEKRILDESKNIAHGTLSNTMTGSSTIQAQKDYAAMFATYADKNGIQLNTDVGKQAINSDSANAVLDDRIKNIDTLSQVDVFETRKEDSKSAIYDTYTSRAMTLIREFKDISGQGLDITLVNNKLVVTSIESDGKRSPEWEHADSARVEALRNKLIDLFKNSKKSGAVAGDALITNLINAMGRVPTLYANREKYEEYISDTMVDLAKLSNTLGFTDAEYANRVHAMKEKISSKMSSSGLGPAEALKQDAALKQIMSKIDAISRATQKELPKAGGTSGVDSTKIISRSSEADNKTIRESNFVSSQNNVINAPDKAIQGNLAFSSLLQKALPNSPGLPMDEEAFTKAIDLFVSESRRNGYPSDTVKLPKEMIHSFTRWIDGHIARDSARGNDIAQSAIVRLRDRIAKKYPNVYSDLIANIPESASTARDALLIGTANIRNEDPNFNINMDEATMRRQFKQVYPDKSYEDSYKTIRDAISSKMKFAKVFAGTTIKSGALATILESHAKAIMQHRLRMPDISEGDAIKSYYKDVETWGSESFTSSLFPKTADAMFFDKNASFITGMYPKGSITSETTRQAASTVKNIISKDLIDYTNYTSDVLKTGDAKTDATIRKDLFQKNLSTTSPYFWSSMDYTGKSKELALYVKLKDAKDQEYVHQVKLKDGTYPRIRLK